MTFKDIKFLLQNDNYVVVEKASVMSFKDVLMNLQIANIMIFIFLQIVEKRICILEYQIKKHYQMIFLLKELRNLQ